MALRLPFLDEALARYCVDYVKVTGLSKRAMYRDIAVASGVQPTGSYPMLVRRLRSADLRDRVGVLYD